MVEPLVRALIGVVAAATAVGVAMVARGVVRRRAATSPLNLAGIDGGVVFFSDAACHRCDEARAALETAGVAFEEIAYDTHPGRLDEAGVTAVPLIVVRRPDGAEVGRIAGKVSLRRLRRLVAAGSRG